MPKIPETDEFIVDLRQQTQLKKHGEPAKKDRVIKAAREKKPAQSLDELIIEAGLSEREDAEPRRFFVSADMKTMPWLNFVKYNNAFLLVLVVGVIASSSLVFASEDVRGATVGTKKVEAQGIDNTLLLETDLDEFSMDFTIEGIIEDEEQFLVSYSFVDLDKVEGAWQLVEKTATRRILKPFRKDLGLYLAGQLGQEAKARIKELNKLQKEEKERGQTKVVQVTKYSGLIGQVLDLSANVFPGYEPVKKIELPTPAIAEGILRRAQSGGADGLANVYNEWVEENPGFVADLNNADERPPLSRATRDYVEADGLETDGGGSQMNMDTDTEGEAAGESISGEETNGIEEEKEPAEEQAEEPAPEENIEEPAAETAPADEAPAETAEPEPTSAPEESEPAPEPAE